MLFVHVVRSYVYKLLTFVIEILALDQALPITNKQYGTRKVPGEFNIQNFPACGGRWDNVRKATNADLDPSIVD